MIVLSHRGYWKTKEERNTLTAFQRSFELGFGTETDIRDYKGELVISHDPATEKEMTVRSFFEVYKSYNQDLPLALNIKADGLQLKLANLLNEYSITNYFMFDTAVPDGLLYIKQNMITFTRQSEYEQVPSFYELADGVWLDEFKEHWISESVIRNHLSAHKKVCIVSPDLHQREYENEWKQYKDIDKQLDIESLMICTDYPEEAKNYFL